MVVEIMIPAMSGMTVVLAFFGYYYAYGLYKRYKYLSIGWFYIALGMGMVVLHRLLIFLLDAKMVSGDYYRLFSILLYMMMMATILFGFWKLTRMFDKYELVSREILMGLKEISRSNKEKRKA